MATLPLTGVNVNYRIGPDERAMFKRCRRQWDFSSPHRRDLEPVEPVRDDFAAAVLDGLAVYYYPGTWDWLPSLRQSLVHKAVERSLREAGAPAGLGRAIAVLDTYDAWARKVDDFAPVKIAHDVRGLVPDPGEPERGLLTAAGSPVVYECRVDLLAVDCADDYWVVRHRIVGDWPDPQAPLRDEDVIAACWTWEQDYPGMQFAGTIHNELRVDAPLDPPAPDLGLTADRAPVAQHEPSGGGRSIPGHQRVARQALRAADTGQVEQHVWGPLRRTRIRRTRAEISAVAAALAAEAVDMTGEPAIHPTPGAHCAECAFAEPCLDMFAGARPRLDRFRRRPAAEPKVRLGQMTWGFGRGAAPPQWQRPQN